VAKEFEEICVKNSFIHQYAAPYDHNSNAKIEREVRTIFEGTATLLSQSGAPSHFWELAQKHFVFTKNVLPSVEQDIGPGGTKVWVSPSRILDPRGGEFN
jgi:hypothetical protein